MLTANGIGQARSTLSSSYTGPWLRGMRLVIRMGVGHDSVARQRIAETGVLGRFTARPRLLISVEYSLHRRQLRHAARRGHDLV